MVKNLSANVGDTGDTIDAGSIPGSGRSPCKRKWQTTPVFLSRESHEQRSLAGYGDTHNQSDLVLRYSLYNIFHSLELGHAL